MATSASDVDSCCSGSVAGSTVGTTGTTGSGSTRCTVCQCMQGQLEPGTTQPVKWSTGRKECMPCWDTRRRSMKNIPVPELLQKMQEFPEFKAKFFDIRSQRAMSLATGGRLRVERIDPTIYVTRRNEAFAERWQAGGRLVARYGTSSHQSSSSAASHRFRDHSLISQLVS